MKDKTLAAICPQRDGCSAREYRERTVAIRAKIRKLGYGSCEFMARYTKDHTVSSERCFLIFGISESEIKRLGRESSLHSVVFKDRTNSREICITPFPEAEEHSGTGKTFRPDDVIRTYSGGESNAELAREVLFARIGTAEGFELYEAEPPRPSYFQEEEHFRKIEIGDEGL